MARIQAGVNVQENMGQLYEQNRGFIFKIASKWVKGCDDPGHDFEELMQEAYFGLNKAVQKFDPSLGFTFITFAGDWINNAVSRYVMNARRLIRIPVHTEELINNHNKFYHETYDRFGRAPTSEEYMEKLNISREQLKALEMTIFQSVPISLNTSANELEDGDTPLIDYIADEDTSLQILDQIAGQQVSDGLWKAIDGLGERTVEILRCRYEKGMTLQDVGDKLGVSRERIRQIENKAFKRLQYSPALKGASNLYGYNGNLAKPVKRSDTVRGKAKKIARIKGPKKYCTPEAIVDFLNALPDGTPETGVDFLKSILDLQFQIRDTNEKIEVAASKATNITPTLSLAKVQTSGRKGKLENDALAVAELKNYRDDLINTLKDRCDAARWFIQQLPENRDRFILVEYYFNLQPVTWIADTLGISVTRVNQIRRKSEAVINEIYERTVKTNAET